MPEPHALRHDEKWNVVCCDLDVCLNEGGVPVGYCTYGEGLDSVKLASSVNATKHQCFNTDSRLATSHGHDSGVNRGVVVPGFKGECYPVEWIDNVKTEGKPMVTDRCLFALNEGNCFGYAESSRACWEEVVVFDNHTDDGHDNVKENCRETARKRNAPFFESDGMSAIEGQTGKVTTCGHRSDPNSKNPMRSDHYQEILSDLESRGLELGSEIEINACGGLGDRSGYEGAEPYKSDELCENVAEATGKKVKVYSETVLQKSDGNGQALSKSPYWRWFWGLEPRVKPAPTIECGP